MGAAPNPAVLRWEKSGEFRELVPSIFSQHRPRPSRIHHPTSNASIVLLSTAVSHQPPPPSRLSPSVTVQHLPALMLPGARGSRSGRIPPSFCPCQGGFFLQSLAAGAGRGKREHQHHGRTVEGPAPADPPSHGEEHPDPSPEQLHIPPRALGKGGERLVGAEALPGRAGRNT